MVKKYAFANYISISFIPKASCSRRKLLSIWKVTSARLIIYLFYIRQNKNRSYFYVICSYVKVDILYLNVPYNFLARS